MLVINLCDKKFNYEFEKLMRLFLPFEKIEVKNEYQEDNRIAVLNAQKDGDGYKLSACVSVNGKEAKRTDSMPLAGDFQKECERRLSVLLFYCMEELTSYRPPWGILTGVRPARLFSRTANEMGNSNAREYFSRKLLVNDEKISLCEQTYKSEEKIISLSSNDSYSLYIGIPFCPSRCSYCSFVSHSIDKAGDLIPDYLEHLIKEIKVTGEALKKLSLKLMTVYVGGGTPTTLSAGQLRQLFDALKKAFDFSFVREFTVEAGRPDTVTRDKLIAIKEAGVTRISINPQTMSDGVLEQIGRRHTAKQVVDAYTLARECGFDNINMDLIAGLPTDTLEGFDDTLSKVLALDPESITVHALSMKRASTLTKECDFPEAEDGKIAEQMVRNARNKLEAAGFPAYYMYRQSKTVGNLENVGYAKPGYEGFYNIYIMDETHTIIACGASAVTKLREPGGDKISRIFNFKYPYEYISRFDQICKRKNGIGEFYGENIK